ncbi:MAG: clostripain-related cysteine peptidase [Pseudomonadota bacterium]
MSQKAAWTIMVYMAGDNNLSAAGDIDLAEMRLVGSTDQVQVVVEFDNAGDAGTRRIHVTREGVGERIETLGETDSGSPEVLSDFISWAAREYPAHRYALILWNHGNGWAPTEVDRIARSVSSPGYNEREISERSASTLGRVLFRPSLERVFSLSSPSERAICSDDGSGHSLDTLELGRVIARGVETIGQKFDLLGMDACLMSNIEVAYQLRDHVRYIVASEENEPADGWPYDHILGRITANPDMGTPEFAQSIVSDYIDWYQNKGHAGDITQAAIDLSKLDTLTGPLGDFADRLIVDMPNTYADIWRAQRKSARFWHNTLWDLGHFCEELAGAAAGTEVSNAALSVQTALEPGEGRFVLAESHRGTKVQRCSGITIYLVPPINSISRYYRELDFSNGHSWISMLEAYHDA